MFIRYLQSIMHVMYLGVRTVAYNTNFVLGLRKSECIEVICLPIVTFYHVILLWSVQLCCIMQILAISIFYL